MTRARANFGLSKTGKLTTLFGAVLVVVGLGSCAPVPDRQGADSTNEDWQHFADTEASTYLAQCQRGYARAESLFTDLRSVAVDADAVAVLDRFNQLDMALDRIGGKASLYRNVHPNPQVREAADICQQRIQALVSKLSLSRPLYDQLARIDPETLNPADRRYLQKMQQNFELAGVSQDAATRAKIDQLNDEIVKLGQLFNRNIREDVRSIEVDASRLKGLPQDYIDAHPVNDAGQVVITTNYPDYLPVMQYARDDDLRLQLYKVFRQRGYPANKQVLHDLLKKRHELAQLLGYDNYAQYITADKMIGSPDKAATFIERINRIARPRADEDYQILLARLREEFPEAQEVGDWQKTWLEELIKSEVYQTNSQEIRQYFAYKNVRNGLFHLVETLFGVQIVPWQADTWDASVEAWQIVDGDQLIGQFYLDMHPRDGKYKHAAAFRVRGGVAGEQTPISALVCNFPGGDGGPGLMEHTQVETFLHEFGHLLHGLFGGHQPRLLISGISTERDFVEAPSQMLEEWAWDADTLKTFAVNSAGQPIPDDLVEKMRAGRDFGRGLFARHQMFYAALSLAYYNQNPETLDLDQAMIDLQAKYSPFDYVDDTYFYASFGHLNGYSAVYYTYMWSQVIAADMFSEFERGGLRNPQVAQRYRQYVLMPGGSKAAAELVADFLGRPYSFEAFEKLLNQAL